MVDEKALADGRAGVDLNAREVTGELADGSGGEVLALAVQAVGDAVRRHGVHARVEQKDLHRTARGRVSLLDRHHRVGGNDQVAGV